MNHRSPHIFKLRQYSWDYVSPVQPPQRFTETYNYADQINNLDLTIEINKSKGSLPPILISRSGIAYFSSASVKQLQSQWHQPIRFEPCTQAYLGKSKTANSSSTEYYRAALSRDIKLRVKPNYYNTNPQSGIKSVSYSNQESNVSQKLGHTDEWHGLFCSYHFVLLARTFKWTDLHFRPIDLQGEAHEDWAVDYLGKQWPPQWWPEGYEPHPSNVIEADIPDIKVGEGLVGEFAPAEASKPKRKPVRADGPLLSPAAIRGLKLEEGDYGFEGEVPLSRPLYSSETLAVSISLEGTELDEDGPRLKKSLLKTKAQAALTRLEAHLPQIHARLLEEGRPYAPTPEAFVETLHDPALLLMAEHSDQGEKWSFVVESDIVGFHFEFDGDTLLDVWSGD